MHLQKVCLQILFLWGFFSGICPQGDIGMVGEKGDYGLYGEKGLQGEPGPPGLEGIEGTKVKEREGGIDVFSFLENSIYQKKIITCIEYCFNAWISLLTLNFLLTLSFTYFRETPDPAARRDKRVPKEKRSDLLVLYALNIYRIKL